MRVKDAATKDFADSDKLLIEIIRLLRKAFDAGFGSQLCN
jgi:hypothetical protein